MKIIREVTPVKSEDPLIVLRHENAQFDYPLHFHPEYEINFIMNFSGKRIVGDSIEDCQNIDLTLLGPYLQHIWKSKDSESTATVITIQFQENFLGSKLPNYKLFKDVKELLEMSRRGIAFSNPTKKKVSKKIIRLCETEGLDTFILFLEVLKELAESSDKQILSSSPIANDSSQGKSRRINAVVHYIENNYKNDISLGSMAKVANMSESAFSHFFKRRTNKSFTKYILDFRIRVATKLLLETEMAINEISFKSGFKTLSNFNRSFKKTHGFSPKDYRKNYIKEATN
ncbi:AraC-like DNA-binding protein [Maribacter vaceletii]|uniref:AraC-like DNA-binding protein n=1 Tax=Maribacter vaceletii TaxID=1206816 RepID=A0A495EDC7_9FLAO|nr:AraC family transcriptional regulator [Maribacter vaceletii]RKR14910.1 AraC-like DNA-binding protein [Maribacter vaceletii]